MFSRDLKARNDLKSDQLLDPFYLWIHIFAKEINFELVTNTLAWTRGHASNMLKEWEFWWEDKQVLSILRSKIGGVAGETWGIVGTLGLRERRGRPEKGSKQCMAWDPGASFNLQH